MVIAAHMDLDTRMDLRALRVLCLDENTQGLDILAQMLMGFGVQAINRIAGAGEFHALAGEQVFDLFLVEAGFGGDGYGCVRAIRRELHPANRTAPIILLSGHTPQARIEAARDCGTNFVIIKPVSAQVLLSRLVWIGRAGRAFIETETYVGPDRRFRNLGIPPGTRGRRSGDLSATVGDATRPNMSQDEIDTLMMPQKLVI